MNNKIGNLENIRRIHLMGVGGAGMSGLALLLAELGYEVSGCDMMHTSYIEKVLKEDVAVVLGHDSRHMERFNPDLLVYSSAIPEDNRELCSAREKGVRVAKRGEVLSWIFDSKFGIGIAGTHGKTTTSSMIGLILEQSGMHPTLAIGGELCDIGVNAKLGSGVYMVAELDESDGSFEQFHPDIAVLTNADWDHVNHYPNLDSVVEAFERFTRNPKENGLLVMCAEDPGLARILGHAPLPRRAVNYGWGRGWTWGAFNVEHIHGGGVSFSVFHEGRHVEDLELSVSGDHNVLNSLAAFAVSHELGIPFQRTKRILRDFKGAKRRLQYMGSLNGVEVFDDYGHHPREIAATLGALGRMYPEKRLVVAFQPHRYTRTQALYREFAEVLSTADRLLLLPVYRADEEPIEGVSSQLIAGVLEKMGSRICTLCPTLRRAAEVLESVCSDGDVVLTIGAGDISNVGEMFLEKAKTVAVHA